MFSNQNLNNHFGSMTLGGTNIADLQNLKGKSIGSLSA
jgi:hypothetical protein